MTELRRRAHYDPSERVFTFETIQDVEPILDNNAALRSDGHGGDGWRHVADIPNVVYQQWFNEYNAGRAKPDLNIFSHEFNEFVKRKLRDPNWSKLLTYDPTQSFSMGWR
jgi:hypothetical protein